MTQEQTELQDELGAATTFQNALWEAQIACKALGVQTIGEGPFLVEVRETYTCRATDAVASSYPRVSERFPTQEQADLRYSELCEYYRFEIEEYGETAVIKAYPHIEDNSVSNDEIDENEPLF